MHNLLYILNLFLKFFLIVDPNDLYIVEPLKFSPEKKVIFWSFLSILYYLVLDEEIAWKVWYNWSLNSTVYFQL